MVSTASDGELMQYPRLPRPSSGARALPGDVKTRRVSQWWEEREGGAHIQMFLYTKLINQSKSSQNQQLSTLQKSVEASGLFKIQC